MSEVNNENPSSKISQKSLQSLFLKEKLSPKSSVKKLIAVVSGKGGVGKSLMTSLLASGLSARKHNTAILDADMTGPSIPKSFGLKNQVFSNDDKLMLPAKTRSGISVMSINLLLKNETDPVLWKGPIISQSIKQFWSETYWEDIDFMLVDMPPGTGDVPLTVFQSLPIDGIIIVSSPQELVSMIVSKAVNMAVKMDVPIIGLVENMSYFVCDNCEKKHYIYGESHIDDIAKEHGLKVLAKLPMDPSIAKAVDAGNVEDLQLPYLKDALDEIEKML
jgi:hypothetical protein